MATLAHISDVHLGPLPKARLRDLASKRITGYANWRLNRGRVMGDATLETLIDDLNAQAPDHIVNTGDIINIGLDAEIDAARQWTEMLGPPERVTFVPGNHDAYVRGTLDRMIEALGPWMRPDPSRQADPVRFPFVKKVGPFALIGVNSAITTAPFVAAGRVKQPQADALESCLHETEKTGMIRVVLIHHPPVRGAAKNRKQLYGITLVQNAIRQAGAELVLHGHTHLPTRYEIPGPDGTVPVIGVPSASQAPPGHGKKPPAAYNLFSTDDARPDVLRWVQRGFNETGGPVQVLKETEISLAGRAAGSA